MIFISYRKADSGDFAVLLAEKLTESFGKDFIFLDRLKIEPGLQWRNEIDAALSNSAVVLALIGSRWLSTFDEYGHRLIDNDDDVLAYELFKAIQKGITIIPLYLHGVKPYPEKAFPVKLSEMANQQGIEFDIVRDLTDLIAKLEKILGIKRKNSRFIQNEDGRITAVNVKPWCLPDSIGALFKGRDEALLDLRNRFLQDQGNLKDKSVSRQVIFGLGGIGKTRLAIEYAWEYQENYSALLFLVGDSPGQLHRSVAELSAPAILNLKEWKYPEEEVRIASVIRWLHENPGWLLIIDNADDKESVDAVQKLLSSLRGGHVIVTSRSSWWSKSVTKYELDVLTPEAAKTFLLDRTNDERLKTRHDDEIALKLALELGGLALALEQAGAYIQNRFGGLSLKDYLNRWKEGKEQVRAWCDELVMHYPRSVAITWETTMQALSPSATTLFRVLSWFAPDPIPRSMISQPGVLKVILQASEESGLAITDFDPEQALSELIAYSMTKKVDEQGIACVGLHRVVLQIMKDRMPQQAKSPTIVAAASLLVLFAPKDSYRPEVWMDWRLLISHSEAIWQVMKELPEQHWNIELMKMLALYYMGQDRLSDGANIQREVLRLLLQRSDKDDPEIYLAKNDLALMISSDEQEQLFREALEGRIRIHSPESTETAETQHNLGSYLIKKDIEEAESLISQAFKTHTKIEGPYNWRTLMAEMSLVSIFLQKNQSEQGEKLLLENIEKKRKYLGIDHPDTLAALSTMVDLCFQKEDYKEAEKFQQELKDGNIKRYGLHDYHTINAISTFAKIKVAQDDYDSANEVWKATDVFWKQRVEALNLIESNQTLNSDQLKEHAVSLNNCALGLRQCGMLDPAEKCLRRALDIDEKERTPGDPKIPHRLMNLSTVLVMQGKLDEATENLSRAWDMLIDRNDVTNLRVLFIQYVIAQLRSEKGSIYLGYLKSLLTGTAAKAYADIVVVWEIDYLLVHLHHILDADKLVFLKTLVMALNFKPGKTKLEEFTQWQHQEPLTISKSE